MSSVISYIKLMRVHQWVKNAFILLPGFFGGVLTNPEVVFNVLTGVLAFSLASSSIYILNDSRDIEKDRLHPTKSKRPLASGKVKVNQAYILMGILFMLSLSIAWTTSFWFFIVLGVYMALNIAYSLKLKQYALVDVGIISLGFVIRVVSGGILSGIEVSKWLFLMTFLLAMILALAKRRDDLLIKSNGVVVRKSIRGYNVNFIDISMGLLSTITLVSYIMYTVSDEVIEKFGNDYIYTSVFFVIFGLLRYLQLALVYNSSGSPTKILYKDKVIIVAIAGWVMFFALVIYVV